MATNFPSSADNFTNPTTSDTLASVSHSAQHADVNDAVEAIETALLDGAPLKIDDANERVGIGTTSPSAPLHVSSTAAEGVRIQKSNNDQQGSYIGMWDDDQRLGYIGYAGNDDLYLENEASAGKTFLSTAGSIRLAIDSSGNVGIGDTTPSYKLDVNGDINATGDVRVAGNPVGMVLVKSQTIGTGVSSVTITDAFSADFENYRIVGLIKDSSNNTAVTWSSPQETGNHYQHAGYYLNLYATPTGATYFGAQSQTTAQCGFTTANSTGDGGAFIMDIFGPYDSTLQTKYFAKSTTYIVHDIWGRITDTYTSLTDIKFHPAAGAFNGGTIRIYGYNDG